MKIPTTWHSPPQSGTDPIFSASEYIATQDDIDDSISTWRLVGADASAFDLSGLFEPRYLNFKEAPDFENPTDMPTRTTCTR